MARPQKCTVGTKRAEVLKRKYGDDWFRKIGSAGGKIGGVKGRPEGVVKGFAVTKKFNWKVRKDDADKKDA